MKKFYLHIVVKIYTPWLKYFAEIIHKYRNHSSIFEIFKIEITQTLKFQEFKITEIKKCKKS